MTADAPTPIENAALQEMLGYLNLSSGTPDARFRRQASALYAQLESRTESLASPPWKAMPKLLREDLERLRGTSSAFAQVEQADAAIRIAFDRLLPAYRAFHRDLLYHQSDGALFRPFFLAKAVEAVLAQGGPWNDEQRIVEGALKQLNDFLGYRPVAVLHNSERMEPYPHEWVAPVPLYLKGAGVSAGPYETLVKTCLEILAATPQDLLRQADYEPENLDELAIDPRAYDFDHPANKRLAYQFGQWDPHQIDNRGNFRRFVATEVTLEVLMGRVREPGELPAHELLWEASAVLAGVVLMASAVSGSGPGAHDSGTTLSTLLPRVANCRDQFYERLLAKMEGPHGERLRAEAQARLQPFAAARQHFNQCLAKRRAAQQQHVILARLFARMGFLEAARRQIAMVPAPSARMQTEVECRVLAAHQAVRQGELPAAVLHAREAEGLLHRAIECGAMVDPWNMLGFGGNYSLFPAVENTVRDYRIEEMVTTASSLVELHARLASEAAARASAEIQRSAESSLKRLAAWWDKFASTEVSGVDGFSGGEAAESAAQVAEAVGAWGRGGAAAGDVAFWKQHVGAFHSPKAYALVIEALLEKADHLAAMALLMQWLGQSASVALDDGVHSFYTLALRWMNEVRLDEKLPPDERWRRTCKFFDYLEANAEELWQAPQFTWAGAGGDDEEENPFAAAYEDMSYEDSTGDDDEGETLEGEGQATEIELEIEGRRLTGRLAFLGMVAELWQIAALACPPAATGAKGAGPDDFAADVAARLRAWQQQAESDRVGLARLMAAVRDYGIPEPSGTRDSFVEFDRRQGIKENLLDNVIKTSVLMAGAARSLLAAAPEENLPKLSGWEQQAVLVVRAIWRRNAAAVRSAFPKLKKLLASQPLLHVPVGRGGDPEAVLQARVLLNLLVELLRALPRLGLLKETCDLLVAARKMEAIPVGPRSVTEFEQLFAVAYQGLVEALVRSVEHAESQGKEDQNNVLIDELRAITEPLLRLWCAHADGLRLSPVEPLLDESRWRETKSFIEKYGHDLFVPRFLNEGNLRGILHHGVAAWLRQAREEPGDLGELVLLEALDRQIATEKAAEVLERTILILLDCSVEYADYNHTTTQSDRGEKLYILLDFLRLSAQYDRLAWRLKPVVLAHEVLVRHKRSESADLWRRSVAEQTTTTADHMLLEYSELTRKHGLRLPTVADRLRERFVSPMGVDCVRALIKPAMDELAAGEPSRSFELLEQEISELGSSPVGVGLDVPDWLDTLDEEVREVQAQRQVHFHHRHTSQLPWQPLSEEEVKKQIEGIEIKEE
ncbi:MAG: hypothetical protein HYS13_15835 [Planctomycetia bacterium]|nr:hypothetical protein [Planctomycetia bacterium]